MKIINVLDENSTWEHTDDVFCWCEPIIQIGPDSVTPNHNTNPELFDETLSKDFLSPG